MFSRTSLLTVTMLAVTLIASGCTQKSGQVTITPPASDAPQPIQPINPNPDGTPIDRPQQPTDQVDADPAGVRIKAVFEHGSLFANESSSVAALESLTMPKRREQAQTWTDKQGRFWLFGGKSGETYRQDLWQLDPGTRKWTEISTASSSVPASRTGALTWVDDSGDLHLAGGEAVDQAQRVQRMDHWVFHTSDGQWQSLSVANTDYLRAHATLVLRAGSSSFFYGGYRVNEGGSILYLDDLWTLTEGGQSWRLVQGSKTATNLAPRPSARSDASLWIDGKGLLWLHAGFGVDQTGNEGHLNDLWSFDGQKNEWTLTFGTNLVESCREDIPEINGPVARAGASHWTDAAGQLWIFGGESLLQCGVVTHLNDLWRFNPELKTWTLLKKRSVDPHARYEATSFGIGSRSFASTWYEAAQNRLWIFGGFGYAGDFLSGSLRDVWTLNQEQAQ